MKIPLKSSLISLALLGGVFFIPQYVSAQSIGTGIVLEQPISNSFQNLSEGNKSMHIGSGLYGSTTAFYLTLGNLEAGSATMIVTLNAYLNDSFVEGVTTPVASCTYQESVTTANPGRFRIDTLINSGGCNLNPTYFYSLVLNYSAVGTQTYDLYGVAQSIPRYTQYTEANSSVAVPYFQIEALVSTLDPSLVVSGNPSGISTSTVQAFCQSSYATSTGLFSDLANAVTYGACTVVAFMFIPNQNVLADFNNLSLIAQQKIPFSYVYQIASVFSTTTSGSNFTSVEFDISSTTVCSTAIGCIIPSVDAFSTTTVSEYIGPDTLTLLRLLMSLVIWMSFAYYVYGVVTRLLAHNL